MESKQPTKAQIREFWEWCGWSYKQGKYEERGASGLSVWLPPSGYDGIIHLAPPDIDLNNLFKYAVPKLYSFGFVMMGHNDPKLVAYRVSVMTGREDKKVFSAESIDPALALFWAIWEVKDETQFIRTT